MMKQWHNCYNEGWKDVIVPEAFSHPAKMAYGLLKRILAHAKIQGWLKEGDVIVDPFGGIGSTGILGAYEGYQVVCCELEEKFYRLANSYECPGITKIEWLRWYNRFGRNKELCPKCLTDVQQWYEKHSGIIPSKEPHHFVGNYELHKDAWVEFGNPFPVILQGDSRQLCQIIVEKADCIVSSPPFLQGEKVQARSGFGPGWRKVPFAKRMDKCPIDGNYGQTPGQLGSMKPGKVDMVVSSPPFQKSMVESGDPNYAHKFHGNQKDYGQTPGNLGNLKSGDVDAIISSPPYEGTKELSKNFVLKPSEETKRKYGETRVGKGSDNVFKKSYGQTKGNLGNDKGDTFWQAAKEIVQQCYQILKPGGYAIWVVKSFVRNKKIVDFPGDWQRLCESVGFKTVCVHHAMLVKETKHQTLFGDTETKRKERKSFFRRLAESKGSPRIDYEVVLCMSKE